ncbi:putative F-box/LRR-repeat protein At3g18150 isoform X1 [Euphorbia lathyris]|uniref:putative F-box/LRR-repeat protein At3g18150 isoform X1 n=1 Tax=Euphorbia lathyris TaxID=212925 RepID=UPI00331359A8
MEENNSEDESVRASSVDDTEEESGGSSSEDDTERAGNKRLKLQGKEDRISALPDSLIHRILSFLPSTKQAIRTGILSKRWQNQWSRVPILIFDSTGKKDKNFSHFIDRTLTLHDCSKIKKFHVQYDGYLESDAQLSSKIIFAIRKDVEELILHLYPQDEDGEITYVLPKFVYNNVSFVKLELFKCDFIYDWRRNESNLKINWPRLKELKLECSRILDLAIEKVVSGSPVLELLELTRCIGFHKVVIASESLKKLIFVDAECLNDREHLGISCPNLEELCIKISENPDTAWSDLPDQTIENVLSSSPLLHKLELPDYGLPRGRSSDRLVIASKSLKKLVLGATYNTFDFEISCPKLEELDLYRFLPFVFTDFEDLDSKSRWERCLAVKILGQLQHVKLLEIGSWYIKILSALEMEDLSSPLLNCKCLAVDGTKFDEDLPGIICAIRSSPVLEKLVIKLQPVKKIVLMFQPAKSPNTGTLRDLNDRRIKKNNYWDSNETVFNCSVSNLKTVKIIGLSEKDDKHKLLFKFVEFLLKNGRMLNKVVVILAYCGTGIPFEVSKKLLSFQRRFPHINIELLSSN